MTGKARGVWFVGDPIDATGLPPDYRIRAYAYGIRIPLRVGKAWRKRHPRPRCGRLLVGQGTDTWDPTCIRPRGHAGLCEGEKSTPPTKTGPNGG